MAVDLDFEVRELKRRLDLTETRVSQLEGQFGFIAGQPRDIQLYMHSRFEAQDRRFDALDSKVDALPRAVAEALRSPPEG